MAKVERLGDGWAWYCPGCRELHRVRTEGPVHPRWQFNGNTERPTFSPSVLVRYDGADGQRVCHSFVREGRMEYLADSTHDLAGQCVELDDVEL